MTPLTTQTRAECDRCGAVKVGTAGAGRELGDGWQTIDAGSSTFVLCRGCGVDLACFLAGGEVSAGGVAVPLPGR